MRDRHRLLAIALGLGLSACAGDELRFLSAAPPETARYWGAVSSSGDFTTPLTETSEPIRAELDAPESLIALAFGGEIGTATVVVGAGLRVEPDCGVALPPAVWAATADDELSGLEPLAPDRAPRVSTAFSRSICDTRDDPLIDIRCLREPCGADRVQIDGCGFDISPACLGAGRLRGRYSPFGEVCATEGVTCSPSTPPPLATAALECSLGGVLCELHFYSPEPVFDLRVERARLPSVPAYSAPPAPDRHDTLRVGWISSYAIVDDAIVAARYRDARRSAISCLGGQPMLWERFDLESMTHVATATAPDCLTHVVATAEGLIGVHGGGMSGLRASRFSTEGRVLGTSAPLATPSGPLAANSLSDLGDGRVAVTFYPDGLGGAYQVCVLDAATLAISSCGEGEGDLLAWGAAVDDAGQLLFADTERDALLVVDPVSRRTMSSFGIVHSRSLNLAAPWFGNGKALVPSPTEEPHLVVFRAGMVIAQATHYEPGWSPLAASGFSAPDTALVSLMDRSDASARAWVAPFDLTDDRFLPGTVLLGDGAATQGLTDGQGRSYFLLSWAGEIVRVSNGSL